MLGREYVPRKSALLLGATPVWWEEWVALEVLGVLMPYDRELVSRGTRAGGRLWVESALGWPVVPGLCKGKGRRIKWRGARGRVREIRGGWGERRR